MEICINKPMEVVWEDEIVIPVVLDPKNSYDKESIHCLDRGYVWVRRKDGECFPEGGFTIVFRKQDGESFHGYRKPAILRNVKENIMENEYHDFIPYAAASFPSFPFTAKFINVKGEVHKLTVSSAGMLPNSDRIVAVAFQKLDPLRVEAQRLLTKVQDRVALADVTSVIVEVLRIQQEEGPKVDVNLASKARPLWFENLMERKRINGESERKRVYDWYLDTNNPCSDQWKIPTALARKLENELLTTRPWTGGGRMVITPYGHALAITNAKKLYWKWKAGERGGAYGMGSHENVGARKPHYSKRTININGAFIEIGCQKIPAEAFTQLAATLKWPDRDPYEYIR